MISTNSTQDPLEGSARFTPVQLSIIAFLISLTSLLVLVSYLWVIVTVARTRSLHTTSNCFLASLAVAEILFGVFGPVISTLFIVITRFSFALLFLLIWMITFCLFGYFLNVTLVAADKWLKISHPFVYVRVVTRAKCIVCMAVVWASSVVGSIIWAVVHAPSLIKDNFAAVYRSFSQATVIFNYVIILPSVVVISALNFAIMRIARRQARVIAADLPAPTHQLHPRVAESAAGAQQQEQAPPNPPARHGVGRYKSTRQFSIYLFSFVLAWVPMVIFMHVVQATDVLKVPVLTIVLTINSSMTLVHSAFGTLILTLVQHDFRQVLKGDLRALRSKINCVKRR